jgi:hypothetical protein
MHDINFFIGVAQQQGCSPHTAQAIFESIIQQLHTRSVQGIDSLTATLRPPSFYVYRTGGSGVSGNGKSGRPRLLLAFPSADAALAFAQHNRLGPTPRLLGMSIAQLLATLVQRATIEAILFADEPLETLLAGQLPSGLRIERTTLLEMLREE